ncbi:MAG TPA: hypothetical protein VF647_11785 [Longimicrobium sp.]|jgi:hypothetical protein
MTSSPPQDSDRLQPPRRGDQVALLFIALAVLVYGGSLAAFHASGLVRWGETAALLKILNVAGVVLTVAALVLSAARDWTWLRREEEDIAFVLAKGRDHLELVLLAPRDRALLMGGKTALFHLEEAKARAVAAPRVQTLMDDRVLRVLRMASEGAQPHDTLRGPELRAIALSRAAGVGDAARYISTLLLLLTVLGTFVGVKASMPALVDALGVAAGTGGVPALQDALRMVSGAFGANLSALLGSIALGLASFGLGLGRNNMLARLEQASSLYVYKKVSQTVATSNFTEALNALRQATGNLEGISSNLEKLGDSLEGLSHTVETSLDKTTETLDTILSEQRERLASESSERLDGVERHLTEVALSVQHATSLYESIAGTLAHRSDALAEAGTQLSAAAGELRQSREAFGTFAESATSAIRARLAEIEQATTRHTRAARRAAHEYRGIRESVDLLLPEARQISSAITQAETQHRSSLETLRRDTSEIVAAELGRSASAVAGAVEEGVRAAMTEAADSLGGAHAMERVTRAVEEGMQAAMNGAADRGSAPVLERVALTLQLLEEQLRRQPGSPVAASAESLDRLSGAVESLEARLAGPVWRRWFGTSKNGTRR